jgi:hypothetical protein
MVAPDFTGARIRGELSRGEDPLPDPSALSLGVFAFQGEGQMNGAEAFLEVLLVDALGARELVFEARPETIG